MWKNESKPEKTLQNYKIVCLIWDEEKDVFIFDLAEAASKQKTTKRNILLILSRISDKI